MPPSHTHTHTHTLSLSLSLIASITPSHTHWPLLVHICCQSLYFGLHNYSSRQPLHFLWYDSSLLFLSLLFLCLSLNIMRVTSGLLGLLSSAIFCLNFFVSHCIFQHLKWVHFTFLSFLASFSNRPKSTETSIKLKPIDSQVFRFVLVENFTNQNFQFRLAKHKKNRLNQTDYTPTVWC